MRNTSVKCVKDAEIVLLNIFLAKAASGLGDFTPAAMLPPSRERPLFACPVSAGFPSPADDYLDSQLDLNDYYVPRPSSTFFVRVTGDSMTGIGILQGDILVVDRSVSPQHGKIVIAVVDNELTVKRFYRQDGRIELHPENPAFPVIPIQHDMELSIWGVVSGVTRKL